MCMHVCHPFSISVAYRYERRVLTVFASQTIRAMLAGDETLALEDGHAEVKPDVCVCVDVICARAA